MLPLLPTHPLVLKVIKGVSCTLIAGALGLVATKLSGMIAEHTLLERVFWIGAAALLFHVLEGIAAGILAHRLKENSVKAGMYTFWTGIAGIIEILQRLEDSRQVTTIESGIRIK
ncbi:hypothetical protein D0962_16050 [Leptolyngbyaceae cyanobacterium CCMR0082]|uniref:Uncharacterized protein n=1 Tax=Adonisia turfae CCMR0082 TaxID=2304604 RepID=A0A6M0S749_9CYAN|nr:hypothetical protein [Adonisia turfae]NEZ64285.1 hypothetical protein [Adonisia turfae CCMR0082]